MPCGGGPLAVADTKSTWYLFDVEKWRGSLPIQRMSFAERGVYQEMLNQQWVSPDRNLPDDPQAVAELIAPTATHVAEVVAAWPVVRRKFVACRRMPGHIYNIKVEEMRRQQRAIRRSRAEAGRLGGKASAAKRWGIQEIEGKQSLSDAQRSLTREEKHREEKSREGEKGVREAPSGPPLLVFPTVGKAAEWTLHQSHVDGWAELYPTIDVLAEARKALAWLQANWDRRKTPRGMPQFLVNWFNRSLSRGGAARRQGPQPVGALSDTMAYNLAASDDAERLILEHEALRTGTHDHRR